MGSEYARRGRACVSNHTTSTGGAATNPVLHSAVAEPDPIPRTIHFVSLGCAKNRVDTEVMLGVSGVEGFTHVEDPADAEVIAADHALRIEGLPALSVWEKL